MPERCCSSLCVQYSNLYPMAGFVCPDKSLTSIATSGETFAQAKALDRRRIGRCRLSLHLLKSLYD